MSEKHDGPAVRPAWSKEAAQRAAACLAKDLQEYDQAYEDYAQRVQIAVNTDGIVPNDAPATRPIRAALRFLCIIMDRLIIQDKPWTAVRLSVHLLEQNCQGVGFSKVRAPDKWDHSYGIALATRKAIASVVRRVMDVRGTGPDMTRTLLQELDAHSRGLAQADDALCWSPCFINPFWLDWVRAAYTGLQIVYDQETGESRTDLKAAQAILAGLSAPGVVEAVQAPTSSYPEGW